MKPMLKKLFYLCLLLFAGGLIVAGYSYHTVGLRLASLELAQGSALLTAPFRITADAPPVKAIVLDELARRGYRRTTSAPQQPGEYYQGTDIFKLYLREWRQQDGNLMPAMLVDLQYAPNELKDHKGTRLRFIYLEPENLGFFGSDSERANAIRGLDEFPDIAWQALLSIEDERFFSHFGIDLIGISRAMVANLRARRIVQGGSTITQQLAKNLFFSPRRTIDRKILEAFAAIGLELRLSKEEILELYLNEVYLGQEGGVALHGFETASKSFFGKSIEEIQLEEAAVLAGIIRAPSYYSPRNHPGRAKVRRDLVLGKMHELGFISQEKLDKIRALPVKVRQEFLHRRRAPHYVVNLREQLARYVNIEAAALAGMQVYTGISHGLQECADQAVSKTLEELESTYPALKTRSDQSLEVGLVAIEPFSGLVRAWVGGRNYSRNQFDHVFQAKRQVGSTIKSFVYLTALDRTLNSYRVATTRSVLPDQPIRIELVTQDTWEPQNYDKTFRGDVTLRYALERSLNIPAVYVAQRVGIEQVARTVRAFRVAPNPPVVPSLALGAVETSLLELTSSYAALANGGIYTSPRLFRSVLDSSGNRLVESPFVEQRVADEGATYVLTNILQGVIERGTGQSIRRRGFTLPAAGKTGTSNETRDAWFVGYTPTLAAGVWVGYDDNSSLGLTGGSLAAPIWAEFMKCSQPYFISYDFTAPPGVSFVELDPLSGKAATKSCPAANTIGELFVSGTEPPPLCPTTPEAAFPDRDVPGLEATQPTPSKRRERGFWEILFGEG